MRWWTRRAPFGMFDTMQIMTEHDAELPRWALTIADAHSRVSLSEDTLRPTRSDVTSCTPARSVTGC